MKRPFLLLGFLLLAGCAHDYDVTLSNGSVIRASNRPVLRQGYYTFQDGSGETVQINALRVRQIAPAERRKSGDQSFEAPQF
jgi:hypothetical protein